MNENRGPIIEKATWKKAVLLSTLFIVIYVLINYFGLGVAGLLRVTGGANILDFEFGYTVDKARQMLTALGETGRAFYLTKILPIDFLFPLSYMLCYVSWIALLLKHSTRHAWFNCLFIVPGFAMLFDWIENIGEITMLRQYPALSSWAVATGSTAGMAKMVFTISSIAVILALLIFFLIKRRRSEK